MRQAVVIPFLSFIYYSETVFALNFSMLTVFPTGPLFFLFPEDLVPALERITYEEYK